MNSTFNHRSVDGSEARLLLGPEGLDRSEGLAKRLDDCTDDDLRRYLMTQAPIEQAKGVLIRHYRCEARTAFAVLRRWSMTQNIKLWMLAAELVEVAQQPGRALEDYLDARGFVELRSDS